jgi:hypothetical protein
MPRTIVDIPDVQLGELDALCARSGISRAEGVRRALQHYLQTRAEPNADGFGLWVDDETAGSDARSEAGRARQRARGR